MTIVPEVIKDEKGRQFYYTRFLSKDDPCGVLPTKYSPDESCLQGISVIHHPTNNCQLANVCNASYLFYDMHGRTKNEREVWPARTKEEFLQILLAIYKTTGKQLLLIDIQEQHHAKFNSFVDPSYIVMGGPYLSTNGHKMGLWIININSLLYNKKLLTP